MMCLLTLGMIVGFLFKKHNLGPVKARQAHISFTIIFLLTLSFWEGGRGAFKAPPFIPGYDHVGHLSLTLPS
jgi:hypothetical protein